MKQHPALVPPVSEQCEERPAGSIARKSFETLLTRTAIQAFGLIGNVIIARTIGPYGKGIFTYADSILLGLMRLSAGQSGSVSLQYGRKRQPGWLVYAAMLRVLAWYCVPITVALTAVAIAVPSQRVLISVACAAPFVIYTQLASGVFLAAGNVRNINIQQAIRTAGLTVLIIPLLWYAHLGINALLITWVMLAVITGFYAAFTLRRYVGVRPPQASEASIFREQFTYGLRMAGNSVVAYLNFRIDVFIILNVLGPKALGIYSIGIGFGELMWALSRPLQQAAFGRIGTSGPKEAARITAKGMRHSIAMVGVVSVLVFFFAPTLVTLMYGKAFAASGIIVRLLLPGMIAYSAMPMLNTFFNQQLGNPNIPLTFTSISTVICASITLLTIHRFGIAAGAIATSASYVTAFALATAYFVRKTGTPLRSIFIFDADDLRHYHHLLSDMWIKALRLVPRRRA
ncbi:MAG: oligosaccharide flippase family protein [Candidatus Eremiobacteraeota bacterium]|nr:oligosaccharide flippase family protein [Candidatus Eremiobacteraeota bacterium]MBC5826206.1 oligosaccharide flippase family protein [Candidatus Eremiobacteraeota bacterium]